MNSTPSLFRRALWPLALLAAIASPVVATAAPNDPPAVNVSMPTEGEALAEGFERAFSRFTSAPLFLTYEKEGSSLRTLAGIRSLRAEGAVIIIVTEKGSTLAIPAKRVLALTDERPPIP